MGDILDPIRSATFNASVTTADRTGRADAERAAAAKIILDIKSLLTVLTRTLLRSKSTTIRSLLQDASVLSRSVRLEIGVERASRELISAANDLRISVADLRLRCIRTRLSLASKMDLERLATLTQLLCGNLHKWAEAGDL